MVEDVLFFFLFLFFFFKTVLTCVYPLHPSSLFKTGFGDLRSSWCRSAGERQWPLVKVTQALGSVLGVPRALSVAALLVQVFSSAGFPG